MINGRNGLSPLVATVLLIAFAVALGTMIMNWSVGAMSEESEDVCVGTDLELQELPDGKAICYHAPTQTLRFLVKNAGTHEITHLVLRAIDKDFEIEEQDLKVDMQQGDIGKFELSYVASSPNEITATILPVILVNGEPQICLGEEEEQVNVPLC